MDSPTHLCNIPIRIFLWLGTCYLTTFDATLDLKCLPEYELLQLAYELTFFILSFYLHGLFFGSMYFSFLVLCKITDMKLFTMYIVMLQNDDQYSYKYALKLKGYTQILSRPRA